MFLYLFLLSILQASSPPSIMQVCLSIACFSIYLFWATLASPLNGQWNIKIFRSGGSAGHLNGRVHDQPTTVPAAHSAPRPAWPPSPSHAATAAPAATGNLVPSKANRTLQCQLKLGNTNIKCTNWIYPIKNAKLCNIQFKTIFNPAPSTAAAATVEPVRWVSKSFSINRYL